MAGIFRTATKEAIREIIMDHATEGRFGILLSDDNMEQITDKVVDLFETTLMLRRKVQDTFGIGAEPEPEPPVNNSANRRGFSRFNSNTDDNNSSFAKTKNAAEIYDTVKDRTPTLPTHIPLPPAFEFKLPRRNKITISDAEMDKIKGKR